MRLLPAFVLPALVLACGCDASAPEPSPKAAPAPNAGLVLQPRRDWVPGPRERELRLAFMLDRGKIRLGEPVRYRAEARNLGRQSLLIEEKAPSFILDGDLCGGFRLFVAAPGAVFKPLSCASAAGGSPLSLTLRPGEALLMRASEARAWRTLGPPAPLGLGSRRLKLVYEAPGLRAESAEVELVVVP